MNKKAKIYIAGHTGLVGSALKRCLENAGYKNLVFRTSSELDLRDQKTTEDFFKKEKPEYVFDAAAKVGGIYANNTYRAEFIYDNLQIQNNIINFSWKYEIKKLLFLGSNCIYPKNCIQPMKEEYLLTGPVEETNEPYAIAKIAGIKMCDSYNRQYKTNFISVIPATLFGPNDNFNPLNSHLVPALIKKFHEAKIKNEKEVVLWGTGTPRREIMYVDDVADVSIFLMEKYSLSNIINAGNGRDMSIKEIAKLIANVVGFEGNMEFDSKKLDGIKQKLLDSTNIHKLGWRPKVNIVDGLKRTYKWYLKNIEKTH